MKRISPTLEAFRVIVRRPIIGFAEITWRWCFGLAVLFLIAVSALEFLDTLPVTNSDLFLLKTRQPFLISQAITHILRGSAPRMILTLFAAGVAMAFAWIVAGALGRAATLDALIFHLRSSFSDGEDFNVPGTRFRTLLGLNFFRAGTIFAAIIASIGAFLLAGAASPDRDPSPGSAFAILMLMILLIASASVMLNWFLSLASVFACTVQADTFTALGAAVAVCRERFGPVLAASSWFALAHLVVFFVATSAVGLPLAFAGLLPPAVVMGGVLLVTMFYFGIVDFLYIGRLAAYVTILETPEMPEPVRMTPLPEAPPRVDQDELILSDVPQLAPASSPY
jgi:hypothetical protein